MSENTVRIALHWMGYANQMTPHGFRAMATTRLNEARNPNKSRMWSKEAIEFQMAHAERNKVIAAYNYAEYLTERRKMMQAWATYLDSLRLAL